MKKILLTMAMSFVLCLPSLAQQATADTPATKADVEKYLDVMHSREMMSQMVEAMSKPMHQVIHDQYIQHKDSLPSDFEQRMNKMMDDMMKDMPWDDILQAMVPVYQKHFTKGDIDALVVFYSSPTGQKMLREIPAVTADSMAAMMPIMRQHIEKMSQRMQDEMVAMLKDSEKKPASAPQSKSK
ncbi:MAG TPA: DUF2059 domain-containing protein [Candidatus Angelobacter sp.]